MKKIVFLSGLLLFCLTASAQENITYQKPPAEIMALADYQRAPSPMMDSKSERMLLLYRPVYKTLSDLNQEELRLAGLRINPVTNISSTMSYVNNLKIRSTPYINDVQVTSLPENPGSHISRGRKMRKKLLSQIQPKKELSFG